MPPDKGSLALGSYTILYFTVIYKMQYDIIQYNTILYYTECREQDAYPNDSRTWMHDADFDGAPDHYDYDYYYYSYYY